MTKIGLLSDTHGFIDKRMIDILSQCDEIWHAGDIGNTEIVQQLEAIKPLRAVYGNIDGADVRRMCKAKLRFQIDGLDVLMTHIGGYPGKYDIGVKQDLTNQTPQLFVCGHSHILKVMFDKQLHMLCMNPGAAGKYGFHTKRTMLLFNISNGKCEDLKVIEWDK